ncbi:hypothetical protein UFOVP49_28 [uncultured Caudovirales phage]|uniref:Uncharacterized protein n=1 Tax=uncultured Caudovirales phage TaxID=2100421 RepID=A0A6J5KSA4_9CAUD|nr:hypothetical protein UFOVP49_28 [uncultured Caudovirales phage]
MEIDVNLTAIVGGLIVLALGILWVALKKTKTKTHYNEVPDYIYNPPIELRNSDPIAFDDTPVVMEVAVRTKKKATKKSPAKKRAATKKK